MLFIKTKTYTKKTVSNPLKEACLAPNMSKKSLISLVSLVLSSRLSVSIANTRMNFCVCARSFSLSSTSSADIPLKERKK